MWVWSMTFVYLFHKLVVIHSVILRVWYREQLFRGSHRVQNVTLFLCLVAQWTLHALVHIVSTLRVTSFMWVACVCVCVLSYIDKFLDEYVKNFSAIIAQSAPK